MILCEYMGQKPTTREPTKTIGQMIAEQAQTEIENKTDEGVTLAAMLDKMTQRQQRFVWAFVETGVQRQAALQAGYRQEKAERAGWEVMQNPNVSQCVERLLRVKYGTGYVMAKFGRLAEKAKGENIQLQATDRLARIAGLYDHEQNTNTTGQHLHIHLPKVENKKNIIDVSAKVSEE